MKFSRTLARSLLFGAIGPTFALPKDKTNDQVEAEIDAGTFQKPSTNVRPRFRYWIPDASADLDAIVDDVKEIARIGASGFELLGFYLYGGPPLGWGDTAPVDWSVYGWGGKAWHKLFKTFAQATKDNGLVMDFAMGANQGQGVPAEYDDDGKAWDLTVSKFLLDVNATKFDGILDKWGSGPLEACVLGGSKIGGNAKVMAVSTFQDLTSKVTKDGKLTIELPEPSKYRYTIISAYLKHSQFQNQDSPLLMKGPQTPPESWVQNGSWAVDHYSRKGAQLAHKFWEEHMLVDGVAELVKEVGNYAWEDSVELKQDYRWTKGFLDRFYKLHGYNYTQFLPTLFGYKTDQWDEGERYNMDYRSLLATLYGEFLDEWTKWTNEKLGIQYSCQVSYGVWMDMQENVPKPNAPEMETLEFAEQIDRYRQYSGPANLAGKRVISVELGGEIYQAFQQTLPRLMNLFKDVVAGGGNQAVIHGSSYTGDYPNTTYPGMVTFGYQFSDSHNKRHPAWDDYWQYMDAMGRLQYIFQSGIPRRDVIIYEKRFWFPGNNSYTKNDLINAGYDYDYIAPGNFQLDTAKVVDGVFAPTRQAAKVMVLRIYDFLTWAGVKKLKEYAEAGLTIIMEGGVPERPWAYHKCQAERIKGVMTEISKMKNVHLVDDTASGAVAAKILELGIMPRTRVEADGLWHTVWREDTKKNIDYVFLYNFDGKPTKGSVDFASDKVPYLYDIWTGEQNPILLYSQANGRTKIDFTMQGNQSHIIAFLPKATSALPSAHATAKSDGVLSVGLAKDTLVARATTGGKVTTSDGAEHDVAGTDAKPFELKTWKLTVEHWDPPKDLMPANADAVKSNSTHELSSLVSWQSIAGLENVSGRGYYEATFSWPPAGAADGALMDVGRIWHSLTLSVNGKQLPPLDPSVGQADISAYLKEGENKVNIVVATTLVNSLRPVWDQMRFSSTTAVKKVPPPQDYGLIGSVVVTPYKVTEIKSSA